MTISKYKNYDTPTLIKYAQQGDDKALEEIIKKYQKNIYTTFCFLTEQRQDISDLTQEVLLRMAQNINKVENLNKFKAWLDKIIANVFYDYAKKTSKNSQIDYNADKLMEIKDKIGCEPGEKCLFAEMEKLIKIAILSLPNNLKISLVLREYEGLSYDDIAQITNTTLGTVKSRISRARIRLQEQLKEFI